MIKKNGVKIIFILTILFCGLFLTINSARAAEATSDRALEIVYPQIPGVATPKVISTGLPDYIKYIFSLSVWLIGLVILGALIYSGFQYFTSFGNPEKFSAAKNGIISAFLGAIILLSAYLLFNTINPQLTILEVKNLDLVEPVIIPGIYMCDYNIQYAYQPKTGWWEGLKRFWGYGSYKTVKLSSKFIPQLIDGYMRGDEEIVRYSVETFNWIMHNERGSCFRVNSSGNFKNFVYSPGNTIFIVPEKKTVYNKEMGELEVKWVYNYGIIFHEKNNYQGKCAIMTPGEKGFGLINNMSYPPDVRSVTLYKKNDEEVSSKYYGVILYECLDYNRDPTLCPEEVKSPKKSGSAFKPSITDADGLLAKVSNLIESGLAEEKKDESGKITSVKSKIRSVQIDPENYYLAVLFPDDNAQGNNFCEVISNSDSNLLDNLIGQCGAECKKIVNVKNASKQQIIAKCDPCTKSMWVFAGQVIH